MRDQALTSRPAAARHPAPRSVDGESGFTLVEVMVALVLTLIITVGLLMVDGVATKTTENFGHLSARATEYAQDKMEQLQILAYGNTTTNTALFPAAPTGGTGLAVGGSPNPATPVAGYVDYLSQAGDILPSGGGPPANWYYIRVWEITSPATNLKQITVTAAIRTGFAGGHAMRSTVSCLKSFPF
jgi:prepilin-type N-terminal cleavage/methylation domain-containing protein